MSVIPYNIVFFSFFSKQKLRKLAERSKNEVCDLESGVYAWEISAQVSSFPWKQH